MRILDYIVNYDSTKSETKYLITIIKGDTEEHSYTIDWESKSCINAFEKLHTWDDYKVKKYRIVSGYVTVAFTFFIE